MMAALSLLLVASATSLPPPSAAPFSGQFFSGVAVDSEGAQFLLLLDQARRMFATADPELMTLTGNYDPVALGITEGAQWKGNFWTQNSYGVGYASLPILPQPALHWISTSFRWWFDHMGDSTQSYGGLADAPDGMLCDNGHPTGCNYMQCGFGRRRVQQQQQRLNGTGDSPADGLATRAAGEAAGPQLRHPSKRVDTIREWEATQDFALHASETVPTLEQLKQRHRRLDTAGVGKDFAIGGTLAAGVMQAEYLLRIIYIRYIHRYLHTNSTYKYRIYIIRRRYNLLLRRHACKHWTDAVRLGEVVTLCTASNCPPRVSYF